MVGRVWIVNMKAVEENQCEPIKPTLKMPPPTLESRFGHWMMLNTDVEITLYTPSIVVTPFYALSAFTATTIRRLYSYIFKWLTFTFAGLSGAACGAFFCADCTVKAACERFPWQFYSCKALDFTLDNPCGGRACLLRRRLYVIYPSFPDHPPLLCLPLAPLQIVAAILAIAGIVMMTYADGFHSHSVIGITFVVASASMSALYKVRLSIWQHYHAHKTFLKWHLCCGHLWINHLSRAS